MIQNHLYEALLKIQSIFSCDILMHHDFNICLALMKEGEGKESFSQLYNYWSMLLINNSNTTAATYIILQ